MSNSDIYTMTPGSAVADTVQQILQRRRDEARQAMLDKLHETQVNDELATNQVQRSSLEQTMLRNRASDVNRGTSESGITDKGVLDYLNSLGKFGNATVTPNVTTSTDFQPPANATPQQIEEYAKSVENKPTTSTGASTSTGGRVVMGNPEEQQKDEATKAITSLMQDPTALAEMTKTHPEMLSLLVSRAGYSMPAEVMDQRDKTVTPISPNGKPSKPVNLGPRGQGMEMNWPPAAYLPPPTPTRVPDIMVKLPDGSMHPVFTVGLDGKRNPVMKTDTGDIPHGSSFVLNKTQAVPKIPQTYWNMLQSGSTRRSNETNSQFQTRQQQARKGFAAGIAQYTTPKVARAVQETVNQLNLGNSPSADEAVMNARKMFPDLTPEETEQVRQIVMGLADPTAMQAPVSGLMVGGDQ